VSRIKCAACGRVVEPVPIVFGYPTAELFEAAARGEVELGGCLVGGDEPKARLSGCEHA
jgi:hypothetical protein